MEKRKGFTLIELIMVIVILGILAAVAIPRFVDLSEVAETNACAGIRGAVASACSIYYANEAAVLNNARFPDSTATIGTEALEGGWQTCPTAGAYTYDGATGTITCDATDHS